MKIGDAVMVVITIALLFLIVFIALGMINSTQSKIIDTLEKHGLIIEDLLDRQLKNN